MTVQLVYLFWNQYYIDITLINPHNISSKLSLHIICCLVFLEASLILWIFIIFYYSLLISGLNLIFVDFIPTKKNFKKALKMYKSICSYQSSNDGVLSFPIGKVFNLIEQLDEHWWSMQDEFGNSGLIPASYLEVNKVCKA